MKARWFTIIEMLVVLAILLILFSLTMPALKNALAQARAIKCLNNLRNVSLATENYVGDFDGDFPSAELNYTHAWTEMFTANRILMRYAGIPRETYVCDEDESDRRLYEAGPGSGSARLQINDLFGLPADARMRISFGFSLYAITPFNKYQSIYQARKDKWPEPANTILLADSTVFCLTNNVPGEYNRIALSKYNGSWPAWEGYGMVPALFPELSRHCGCNNILFMDAHARLTEQIDTYKYRLNFTPVNF